MLVGPGDTVAKDDSLLTLESDKATMEIPSPFSGVIQELKVGVGDKVSKGALILVMETEEEDVSSPPAPPPEPAPKPEPAAPPPAPPAVKSVESGLAPGEKAPSLPPVRAGGDDSPAGRPHAAPGVRRFARELGVDLYNVKGTGPKGRIRKEDVQSFVKTALSRPQAAAPSAGGFALPQAPVVDFSKFGDTEVRPLSRIKKISGVHLHRSWLTIPHVTQFDEAEITEMEAFRQSLKGEAAAKGLRVTPLVFLLKAAVAALRQYPEFNASLDSSGENLILKKYFNIGVAVDTPEGLVVPVIRDVDKKGVWDLAAELGEIAEKARAKKLTPTDLQGGCFSISSLGGIGGTNFAPIINAPEVAILGVAKSQMKPVYQADGTFRPGLMLPISLSYDHRVIDGAAGVRFTTFLCQTLSDIRRLVL